MKVCLCIGACFLKWFIIYKIPIWHVIFYADTERKEVYEQTTSGVRCEVSGAVELISGVVCKKLIGQFQDNAVVNKDVVFCVAVVAHEPHRCQSLYWESWKENPSNLILKVDLARIIFVLTTLISFHVE